MSATFVLLYLAGARLTHLIAIVVAILPALAWSVVHHEYRWRRLVAFWEPSEDARTLGYQIVQSFVAFGSGGVFGRGLGGGTQKLFYLRRATPTSCSRSSARRWASSKSRAWPRSSSC